MPALALLLPWLAIVSGQQRFLSQPRDLVASLGARVVLQCSVEGRVGRLQWTRDGFGLGHERALPGFPNMRMVGRDLDREWHLQIDPVGLSDEGDYQCQVTSGDARHTIRSSTAHLEVSAPCSSPTIAPSKPQFTKGLSSALRCTCGGARPPARLRWQLGGEGWGLGNSSTMEEPGKKTYRTVSVLGLEVSREQDGMEVRCSVAGSTGHEAVVTLSVNFPPHVEVVGAGKEAGLQVGDQGRWECQASSRPEVERWGWRLAGKEVGEKGQHLVIEKLVPEHQGMKVACWAENSLGRGEAEVELFLHVAPAVVDPPRDVRAVPGEEVVLHCRAEGSPEPRITWYRVGGTEVGSGASFHLLATPATEGQYYCTASSPLLPTATSPPALLSLARLPVFDSPDTQYSSLEALVVECRADNAGEPVVAWSRKGTEILQGGRFTMEEEEQERWLLWRLKVANATARDLGKYTCTVENDMGSSSQDITMIEDSAMLGLQLGLGIAGLLSCTFVLLAAIWFCRSLAKSAALAQQEREESEEDSSRDEERGAALRASRSVEPPDRSPSLVAGPVLHTIRPDFAAFYGNPHLSCHLQEEGEEVPLAQFSAIYGNPHLSRPTEDRPNPPKSVYFSESPPVQDSRPEASKACRIPVSEGGESVYSEPLLPYQDLASSAIQLDCEAPDDISTLAD